MGCGWRMRYTSMRTSTPRDCGETSEQEGKLGELLSGAETIARVAADAAAKIDRREQCRERRSARSAAQDRGAQGGTGAAPMEPCEGQGREACDADEPAQRPRGPAQPAGERLRFRLAVGAHVGEPPNQPDGT